MPLHSRSRTAPAPRARGPGSCTQAALPRQQSSLGRWARTTQLQMPRGPWEPSAKQQSRLGKVWAIRSGTRSCSQLWARCLLPAQLCSQKMHPPAAAASTALPGKHRAAALLPAEPAGRAQPPSAGTGNLAALQEQAHGVSLPLPQQLGGLQPAQPSAKLISMLPHRAAAELSLVRAEWVPGSKQPEQWLGVKEERAQEKTVP